MYPGTMDTALSFCSIHSMPPQQLDLAQRTIMYSDATTRLTFSESKLTVLAFTVAQSFDEKDAVVPFRNKGCVYLRLTILRRNLSHECQMNMFDYEYVDHDKLSGLCFVLCFILAAQQVDRRTFFVRLSRSPTGLDLKETQGSLTSLHLSCAECVLLFMKISPPCD